MMIFNPIVIPKDQLAIVYDRYGDIKNILRQGKHFVNPFKRNTIQFHALNNSVLDVELTAELLRYYPDWVAKECIHVECHPAQMAVLLIDNRIHRILAPSKHHLIWKTNSQQTVETIDLDDNNCISQSDAKRLSQWFKGNPALSKGALTLYPVPEENMVVCSVNNTPVDIVAKHEWLAQYKQNTDNHYGTISYDVHDAIDAKTAQLLQDNVPSKTAQHCQAIKIHSNEVGLRYENDVLVEILPPDSQHLFWRRAQCRIDVLPLGENETQVPQNIVDQVMRAQLQNSSITGSRLILLSHVPAYHLGVVSIDGKVTEVLGAGVQAFWCINRQVVVEHIDTRLQGLEISGQEILTKDKVNLRITLIANWQYQDVLLAMTKAQEPETLLYRELQFALRQAVGTRSLDELLEDKNALDDSIQQYIAKRMPNFGIDVQSVGVKDIILPGEMKEILAQVVAAEKSAQANVVRRREETSATRALLNTAKVMENNPIALRLKEMETLEKIAERITNLSVVGGLDQVLHGLVNIQAPK